MIRPSTALFATAVIVVGYAMFQVKYEVMAQEEELARLNHQIADGKEAIRVLNAEWSFLTQPARLAELSKRYLELAPISTSQLTTITALPMRNQDTQPAPSDLARAAPPPPETGARTELATLKTSVAR